MMQIRRVWMLVGLRVVGVRVAVLTNHWRLMLVLMMAVVVPMSVIVLHGLMSVAVGVLLGEVQIHAEREQ